MASNFIGNITKPLVQPLLQQQQQKQQAAPRNIQKKLGVPTRKSARLAALTWPRGDSLSRARQVLMKRLGVTQEEGQSSKEALLRYINLFKGPLSDLVTVANHSVQGMPSKTFHIQIW